LHRRTGEVLEENPNQLKRGHTAIVELVPLIPLSLEEFKSYPALGRFVAYDMKTTIAVGIVKSVQKSHQPQKPKAKHK
jgi:elongation factor 1-alpha